jgi:hypothetical protein
MRRSIGFAGPVKGVRNCRDRAIALLEDICHEYIRASCVPDGT